jgi:hypothetical protein
LLLLSVLFLCTTFGPLVYSVFSPDEEIDRVLAAMRDGGTPPLDADTVVQEAKASAGNLTSALRIAYYSGWSKKVHLDQSGASENIRVSEMTYLGWFQKRPNATFFSITIWANDRGQRAYRITPSDPTALARGYAVPVALFGIAMFLVRKRHTPLPPRVA